MQPQLLVDFGRLDPLQIVSESKADNTMKVRGIFGRADEFNNNNRRYKKSLLEREVNNLLPLINESRLLGALDHPDSPNVSLMSASHLITGLNWQGNILIGEAKLLGTPAGKIAQQLIKDGVKIGISSRGLGTLSESKEHPGKMEVNEDYKMVTFDLVADPSTKGAFPGQVSESKLFEQTQKQAFANKLIIRLFEDKLSKIKEDKIQKLFESRTERKVPHWANKAETSKSGEDLSEPGKMKLKTLMKKGLVKPLKIKTGLKGNKIGWPEDEIRSPKDRSIAKRQAHKKQRQEGKKEVTKESLINKLREKLLLRESTYGAKRVTRAVASKKIPIEQKRKILNKGFTKASLRFATDISQDLDTKAYKDSVKHGYRKGASTHDNESQKYKKAGEFN